MNIKRNKDGTYTIENISLGKMVAIVNAIKSLRDQLFFAKSEKTISTVQEDVLNLIQNNPEFRKDTQM